MKAILVAPLIAIGIKALPEKEIWKISQGEWAEAEDVAIDIHDGGNSNLKIYIDNKEVESNIFARVKIEFGGDGPPVYEFEYIDENEL